MNPRILEIFTQFVVRRKSVSPPSMPKMASSQSAWGVAFNECLVVPTITLYRVPNTDLSDHSIQTILEDTPSAEIPVPKDTPFRLFIFRDPPDIPDWAKYVAQLAERPLAIEEREAVGAILLVKPLARARVLYAVTWGIGRFHLRSSCVETDWGLRCALNLISGDKAGDRTWDPARVRAVRSKRVSQNTLIAEIQSSRKTTMDSFPFSADVDQLRRVTGTPTNASRFGSTISGGISIHIKRPDNATNLLALCRKIEHVHKSTDYQRHFGWIDNVSPVTDQATIAEVYDRVVAALKGDASHNLTLSPPTIVQWENVSKFSYQWGHKSEVVDEPSIDSFRQFLAKHDLLGPLSASALREKPKLSALDDANNRIQSWPISRCLSAEFRIGVNPYILDDGSLLDVAVNYLHELNNFTNEIASPNQSFPTMKGNEAEDKYNTRVSNSLPRAILLDRQTVKRRQATAIEVCDVATANRQLIHVKKGTSSSSLSHLFAQGVVSAELLHMDADFRNEVSKLLSSNAKRKRKGSGSARMRDFEWLYDTNFEPLRCEVVYAVMTGRPRRMRKEDLPFFSKVNLRMRCHELRRMGYKYSLTLVHV
jgi:uncharacterized protein (TIGR04141 family)